MPRKHPKQDEPENKKELDEIEEAEGLPAIFVAEVGDDSPTVLIRQSTLDFVVHALRHIAEEGKVLGSEWTEEFGEIEPIRVEKMGTLALDSLALLAKDRG